MVIDNKTPAKNNHQSVYLGEDRKKLEELVAKERERTGYEPSFSAVIRRLISDAHLQIMPPTQEGK